jgi:hypothetical protein
MRGSFGAPAAWLLAAAASAACLGVIYATPSDVTWIVDCGSKALLAQRLLATGFADVHLDYPAALLDPTGDAFPGGSFALSHAGGFVSVFPPAYSALAVPFLALLGDPGLRVPAALGAGACALLAAVWLAPGVGRGRALVGAAALAFATPLFFYGVTVWEHDLCVALGLAAWVALATPTPGRSLAAGLLAGAACWLREEQLLMVGAIALACALQRRRASHIGLFLAAAAVPILALAGFNQAVYGDPLGVHLPANLELLAGGGPAEAVRQVIGALSGLGVGGAETIALGLALALAWGAGWIAGRRASAAWAFWVAATLPLLAWGYGVFQLMVASDPLEALVRYNGLLLQLPLSGLAGLGLARVLGDPTLAPLRIGVFAGLAFLAAAVGIGVATGSPLAFGVHWGPRMLLPAVPALVALYLAALPPPGPGRARRLVWGASLAAGLLSSVLSVGFLVEQKREAARLEQEVLENSDDIVVSTHPYAPVQLFSLGSQRRVLVAERAGAMMRVVATLSRNGGGEFLLIGRPSTVDHTFGERVRCDVVARHRGRRITYLDADLQRCEVEPAPALRDPRIRSRSLMVIPR